MLGRAVGDGSGQMECSECPARTIRLPVVVRPVLQSADCREVRERSYRARMAGWRPGPQRRRTARCPVAVRCPVYHGGLDFLAGLGIDQDHAALGWREPGVPPGRESNEDGADRAPEVGQHVLIARRIGLVLLPLEQASRHHPLETAGQHAGGDLEPVLELIEADAALERGPRRQR
jgi:hypothetical protein